MVSLPGQALAAQTLSINGREERVKGDGSDVIICAFTRDHVEESLPLPRVFLSSHIVDDLHVESNKQLFVTSGCHTLSRSVQQVFSELDPCSHEEADTRMMLHVFHAVNSGYNKIMIRTVDTDVVVLAINFQQRHPVMELWVVFGTGKNLRYIAVHELVSSLGPERAQGILFFRAFTGCDTVSSFGGHGKKSAWDTWNSFPNVTDAFVKLSSEPHAVSENSEYLPTLERFVVLLYDRTSNKLHVNDSRKQLFTKKCRGMDSLPPTQATLIQHIKRAILQSGYCWYRSLQAQQIFHHLKIGGGKGVLMKMIGSHFGVRYLMLANAVSRACEVRL